MPPACTIYGTAVILNLNLVAIFSVNICIILDSILLFTSAILFFFNTMVISFHLWNLSGDAHFFTSLINMLEHIFLTTYISTSQIHVVKSFLLILILLFSQIFWSVSWNIAFGFNRHVPLFYIVLARYQFVIPKHSCHVSCTNCSDGQFHWK